MDQHPYTVTTHYPLKPQGGITIILKLPNYLEARPFKKDEETTIKRKGSQSYLKG